MLLLQMLKNNLLLIKISAIVFLLATTSYITWQVAMKQVYQEKLEIASMALKTQQKAIDKYLADSQIGRLQAIASAESNYKLETAISKLTKEHRNEKPLPIDCVLDDSGVQYLETSRREAISAASSEPDNSLQRTYGSP